MIMGYWDRNNFTLLPRVGRSTNGTDAVFRVRYFRWFGWTWCKMTAEFTFRMMELIRKSPDEVATVAGAYAAIRTKVSQEVQQQTQWMRDELNSYRDQLQKKETELLQLRTDKHTLTRALQIVKDAEKLESDPDVIEKEINGIHVRVHRPSCRMTDHRIDLDDGK